MKRNTALRWIGWLGTFTVAFYSSLYQNLLYGVGITVAHFQYDFPLLNVEDAIQANPDIRSLGVLYAFGILVLLAIIVGGILVGLFGEPKVKPGVQP